MIKDEDDYPQLPEAKKVIYYKQKMKTKKNQKKKQTS